jgi:hypothetical protein
MTQSDYQYFQSRAQQEDEAARVAKCLEAQVSHQRLAEAYRDRCRQMLGNQVPPAIRDSDLSRVAVPETRQASPPKLRTAFGLAPTVANHREKFRSAAS